MLAIAAVVLVLGFTALYVISPLLGWGATPAFDDDDRAGGREQDILRQRREILAGIKDLDLEYAVGKLTKEDYEQTRARLSEQAVDIYRQMDRDEKA